MSIQAEPIDPHWNYFLALEEDLAELARYVEPSQANFKTYSIEMVRLLLAASSEVDVVMKLRCRQLGSRARSIDGYRKALANQQPRMPEMRTSITRYGLELTPWKNWQDDRTPKWWADHNKVKHERNANFARASLENVLNAVGGLFLLLLTYYAHGAANQTHVSPLPKLFEPPQIVARRAETHDGRVVLSLVTPQL